MISAAVRALFDRLQNEPRRIVFPMRLPSLNELNEAQHRFVRTERGGQELLYARIKRELGSSLCAIARRAHLEPVRDSKVIIATNWRETDRRRDLDNIVSGGRKLVLDALTKGRAGPRGWPGAGILETDGWRCIAGFVDICTLSADAGVEVVIAPVQLSLSLSPAVREAREDLRPRMVPPVSGDMEPAA